MKNQYKYQIVGTITNSNRPMYLIAATKNKVERVVGIGRLTRMYHDGYIIGPIDQYIKEKMGLPRRKVRSDRKNYVEREIEPVKRKVMKKGKKKVKTVKNKWNLKDEVLIARGLPDVWECMPLNNL